MSSSFDPMDCSQPGSSGCGISQVRILEQGAMPSSRRIFWPRFQTRSLMSTCVGWRVLYHLEKEMATHSSTLAWKIPWMEEPGRLELMRSQRVGHVWVTSLSFPFFTTSTTWEAQGEEVGGTNRDSSIEIYTLSCVKLDSQCEFAVFAVWLNSYMTSSVTTLRGEWGRGREVHEGGDICTPMADPCWCMAETTQYCKAIILQLKINNFLKRKKKKKKKVPST